MTIAQQALCAVAISRPAGPRIRAVVPLQRQSIATPETAVVPTAR